VVGWGGGGEKKKNLSPPKSLSYLHLILQERKERGRGEGGKYLGTQKGEGHFVNTLGCKLFLVVCL